MNKKELDNLNEDLLNYDTFDLNNFNDITNKIVNYVSELFQKKNYYSLDDIVEHIQYHKNMNKYIIYNSLKNIIDYKKTIYDKNKNMGYIICGSRRRPVRKLGRSIFQMLAQGGHCAYGVAKNACVAILSIFVKFKCVAWESINNDEKLMSMTKVFLSKMHSYIRIF